MSIQKIHGNWGEELAASFLEGEGYEIVERNWRYKRAEVDLIAREGGILVFIEVKTRANVSFGRPEEMVNQTKKRLVYDAAMAYMRSRGYDWEIRFDIVAITGEPGKKVEIELFRDAFFPGLDHPGP